MWNENVTLYIDDNGLRMLVMNGLRVKKWAEMQLDPGLVKGGVVVTEGEVASRIKQLFKNHEIHSRKVTLGISGLHSLTRPATLPILPRNMLLEAVAREARRVLPVPLDQLYLSWRLMPSSGGKISVFMAATPRKTADSLMNTLRIAGLTATRMSLKPLALVKMVPASSAILVDAQPDEFDIIILADGVPHPIRSVSFPDTELNWAKKVEMMASDVDRTIKFFDSNNQDKPLSPDLAIYVSGGLISDPELHKKLSETVGRKVVPLALPLKGSEQVDLSRFMINIAMSATLGRPAWDASQGIANINVLPAPYQPKPISTAKLVGIPAGVAVLGLLAPILMLMQNTSSNIASLQSSLDKTQQAVTMKTAARNELNSSIADLQKKVDGAKISYQNLKIALDVISASQEIVNGDLKVALDLVPAGVTVSNITQAEGSLSLQGTAVSKDIVLTFAKDLDSSKRFAQTTVASLEEPAATDDQNPEKVSFSLTLLRDGK